MRKLFILCLLVSLALVPTMAWADATNTTTRNARTATLDYASGGAVAISDLGSGYTQQIDSAGAASVMEYPKTIAQSTALFGGVALVSSACRVATITYGGNPIAAGSTLLIYDAASATGTPVFDISVGTANDTKHLVIPGGATFSTGVFAQSDDAGHITITYDN